jgi:hypothetical protein
LPEIRRGSLTEQFLSVKRKDGSRVKRGPYPLLTRKQGRKTVSQRLTDPALVPLYRQQIQAMRQFETVVDGLVQVGEQLRDLAVAEVVQKKLLVELEQAAEVRRLAAALAARQTPDFEAWEGLLLQAARQGGAGVLGALLEPLAAARSSPGDPLPVWPAHEQLRPAPQTLINDPRPGAFRAVFLRVPPLWPETLSRRRASGHDPNHLFARGAPTHGACR